MRLLAIQYLEDGPKIVRLSAQDAQTRLREALARVPLNMVLLGWNLPDALVDACATECQGAGAELYRWHPLLTGDGTFEPMPAWRTVDLNGAPIPGFQDMPEFTFVCPNRAPAREAVFSHLRDVLQDTRYQGVFLDRMRYPSPAADPESALGCFCEDCHRAAANEGLDLQAVRASVQQLLAAPERSSQLVRTLLLHPAHASDPALNNLAALLDFRSRSVSRFICEVASLAHSMGKRVGVDCFSPALTRLVGQDLGAVSACAAWTKIMSYGHTLGPAGLPFELLALANWLVERRGVGEKEALAQLSDATRLPLPPGREALQEQGLSPYALRLEAQRARAQGVSTLLAGIELVEMEGVTRLDHAQIVADLAAFRQAGVDGLVISWDLWEIPLERLDLVRAIWR